MLSEEEVIERELVELALPEVYEEKDSSMEMESRELENAVLELTLLELTLEFSPAASMVADSNNRIKRSKGALCSRRNINDWQ